VAQCWGQTSGTVFYKNLLKIQLLEDTEIIAFANDVVLVSTISALFLLKRKLEKVLVALMKENDLK